MADTTADGQQPKRAEGDATNFATFGAAKKQGRKWVDSKAKQGQSKALIKHIFSHHIGAWPEDEAAVRERGPCACGYTEQEILDKMDWSDPTPNAFYYATAYRDYPRLIKRTQHLDHSRYARMIAGFKPVPEVLSFFAISGARMGFEELESILNRRFGGSLWNDPSMRKWVLEKNPSSRAGMLNRWRKCELIRPIVDAIAVAETMME